MKGRRQLVDFLSVIATKKGTSRDGRKAWFMVLKDPQSRLVDTLDVLPAYGMSAEHRQVGSGPAFFYLAWDLFEGGTPVGRISNFEDNTISWGDWMVEIDMQDEAAPVLHSADSTKMRESLKEHLEKLKRDMVAASPEERTKMVERLPWLEFAVIGAGVGLSALIVSVSGIAVLLFGKRRGR